MGIDVLRQGIPQLEELVVEKRISPFQKIDTFLPHVLRPNDQVEILKAPIRFQNVTGWVIANAGKFEFPAADGIVTPMGPANFWEQQVDNHVIIKEAPVRLCLRFNVLISEDLENLEKHSAIFDLGNDSFKMELAEHNDFNLVAKRDLVDQDRVQIRNFLLRQTSRFKDIKDVLLPMNLAKLHDVGMRFVEK